MRAPRSVSVGWVRGDAAGGAARGGLNSNFEEKFSEVVF